MNYSIQQRLGIGGLAEVFQAVDEAGNQWALKRLKAAITDEKLRSRFRQEVRIQSMLRHSHIVPVIAANPNAEHPFYVMPRADSNLEEEISRFSGNHPAFQEIATQIISGLTYAHEQRILHRDLKPRNILILGGHALIADFGLGKAIDREASYTTTTSDTWGTYWYASPEQENGLASCDVRSDIYSLGKLFLECLAGRRVNEIPETVSEAWQYIIRRCIRDDPSHRWQSMAELERQYRLVFGIKDSQAVDPANVMGKLAQIASQPAPITIDQLKEIQAIAVHLPDDEVLLRQVFDKLPPNLVSAWHKHDPAGFVRFVKAYDDSLGELLSFEYCDVVANQYAMIHDTLNDAELRDILRCRLYRLGPTHNRWHVGSTLGAALCSVRDPADIARVLDMIQAEPKMAVWNEGYCMDARIDKRIRDAMRSN